MEIIWVIIYLAVLATSLPAGRLLAWLCEDELLKDRKYFIMLAYFLIIAALGFIILYFDVSIVFSIVYMLLILLVMLHKSKKYFKQKKK